MKVNDPNLSTAGSAGAARASEAARVNTAKRAASSGAASKPSSDDVHLSELVRSLRSLASDSPERQAKIEHLTRAYATGSYKIDAEATAAGIIHDSLSRNSGKRDSVSQAGGQGSNSPSQDANGNTSGGGGSGGGTIQG